LPQDFPLNELLFERCVLDHAFADLFSIRVQLVLDDGVVHGILVGIIDESAIASEIAALFLLAGAVDELLNGWDELLAALDKVGGFEGS
jgi:hypothetical protein